jgi:hypothetical protein
MVETSQDAAVINGAKSSPFIEITLRQCVFIALTGLGIGIAVWILTNATSAYIFHPLMCREGNGGACGGVPQYSEILAIILASAAGLFSLVRLQTFRPLLIVLAGVISLWGIVGYTSVLFPWYEGLVITALLYMVACLTFMWITRIRLFWIVVVGLLIVIIAIRMLLG